MSTYLACEVCQTTRYRSQDHRDPHRPGCPAAAPRRERIEQDAAPFPSGPHDHARLEAWEKTEEGLAEAHDAAVRRYDAAEAYRARQR